jgi:hypothetical protein
MTGDIAIAQHIHTRVLTPAAPMQVTVNPNVATTLLFPNPIGGAFGLGHLKGRSLPWSYVICATS